MAKVTELSNPKGLMVIVRVDQWKAGIFSLLNSAEARCIYPSVISLTRLDGTKEDVKIEITLWGDM